MADVSLKTAKRETSGKAVQGLREQGLVPGVVYGQGKESVQVQADAKLLDKVYHDAGTSKLVDLVVGEDEPKSVLFYDVQHDPLTHKILHFDLYTVKMDEKIHTEVPIHFVGESEAVIAQQAELVKNLELVEVEALPRDLPENLEVDVSLLKEVGDSVAVGDLKLPEGVEVTNDPEVRIVGLEEVRETTEEDLVSEVEEEELPEAEHGGEAGDTDDAGAADDDSAKDDAKDDKGDKAEPAAPEGGDKGKSDADKKAA